MNTLIFRLPQLAKKASTNVPSTGRGRALFTTDWFLNGQPALNKHDNPCLTLKNGMVC